jgi:hypothetical protein
MESPERRQDHTPFKDTLIENTVSVYHVGKEKLYAFENDPSKVVRVETFQALQKRYGWPPNMERNELVREITTLVREGRGLFNELTQEYGIPAPVSFLIGKDPSGHDAVYAITEKIVGKNLDALEPTPALAARVEALYEKLAEYHADKWASGDPFLVDIDRIDQFVYGRSYDGTSDKEPEQIYLVDTDLRLFQGAGFARQLTQVERRYKTQFPRARATIEALIEQSIPESFTEKGKRTIEERIAETRDILTDNVQVG